MAQETRKTATNPRRVLVTGGAGFIGSHLVEHLLARGDHVTVVDNCSTGRASNLQSHPSLRFLEADLKEALAAFGKGETFDEIYHLAAAVGVRLVIIDPIGSIQTNIEQTLAVLRFSLRGGPGHEPARVLIASSSEVYGKGVREPFSEEDDVVYGPTTKTRWSYAASKAVDEYLALAHARTHSLPAVVVRFFNTVGPRQVGDYGMVVPRFVASAVAGQPIEVYGDGLQSRCFCDVRDVVRALPQLLAAPRCAGRVFNLGSDQPISINDLAKAVIRVVGSKAGTRHIPYSEAYPEGFEDLKARRPDLTRIREAIGFSPQIPLDQTIRDVAAGLTTKGGG